MVAPLRILYVTLALTLGFGLTAAGVLGLMDLVQISISGASYLEGALPFSLSTHAYTPALGAIALVSAFAAVRRRWQILALACWFLLGTGVLEALYMIWTLAAHDVVPETATAAFVAIWSLFPVLGLLLAARARPRGEVKSDMPASVSTQERIRLRNTLVGVAAVSYIWRAIAMWLSPGITYAIAYLQGISDIYGPEQVVLSGVVGLCAAIVLIACVGVGFKDSDRVMHAVLAFTAGFALEGFFDTVDYVFRLGSLRELTYSLQDAVAFVACCAALALSVRTERISSHAKPA